MNNTNTKQFFKKQGRELSELTWRDAAGNIITKYFQRKQNFNSIVKLLIERGYEETHVALA